MMGLSYVVAPAICQIQVNLIKNRLFQPCSNKSNIFIGNGFSDFLLLWCPLSILYGASVRNRSNGFSASSVATKSSIK